jgi:hypothetical protein
MTEQKYNGWDYFDHLQKLGRIPNDEYYTDEVLQWLSEWLYKHATTARSEWEYIPEDRREDIEESVRTGSYWVQTQMHRVRNMVYTEIQTRKDPLWRVPIMEAYIGYLTDQINLDIQKKLEVAHANASYILEKRIEAVSAALFTDENGTFGYWLEYTENDRKGLYFGSIENKKLIHHQTNPISIEILSESIMVGDNAPHLWRFIEPESSRDAMFSIAISRHLDWLKSELQNLSKMEHEEQGEKESATREKRSKKVTDVGNVPLSVLVMYFLFESLEVTDTDNVHKVSLIRFLTGLSEQNIRAALSKPFQTKGNNFRDEDLQIIKPYFQNLGLYKIVQMIDNQLNKRN